MAQLDRRPHPLRTRRIVVVSSAVVAILLLGGAGAAMQPQNATVEPPRVAQVGRTTSICTVAEPEGGQQTSQVPTTVVSGVSIRQQPDRGGSLTGATLDTDKEELKVSESGKGAQADGVRSSVVLSADGAMASNTSGSILSTAPAGDDAGLAAAPCLAPATSHWFSGLGAEDSDRTELILTNPDETQAEVDLRFYGRRGRVVVPGSPGLTIDAHSSRVVSLSGVVKTQGALGLSVQTSQGRVTAVAKRLRTDNLKPSGVDWLLPSAGPSTTVLIPGVPGDEGGRQLVVTNPGTERASVQVQLLGLQGSYTPTGAEVLEVAAESSATVDLEPGLTGEAASVRLTSDFPVTGAVISTSRRVGAADDLALQSAVSPLVRLGVSATATTDAADSELILSNTGDTDASVTFEVLSYDGVTLRTDEVLLAAGSTATRRLNSPAPSYVVVSVPDGSSIIGGVVLTQPEGDTAGLATLPLTSPDVAGRAPDSVSDPSVGH